MRGSSEVLEPRLVINLCPQGRSRKIPCAVLAFGIAQQAEWKAKNIDQFFVLS
jgi:hypothetical protein